MINSTRIERVYPSAIFGWKSKARGPSRREEWAQRRWAWWDDGSAWGWSRARGRDRAAPCSSLPLQTFFLELNQTKFDSCIWKKIKGTRENQVKFWFVSRPFFLQNMTCSHKMRNELRFWCKMVTGVNKQQIKKGRTDALSSSSAERNERVGIVFLLGRESIWIVFLRIWSPFIWVLMDCHDRDNRIGLKEIRICTISIFSKLNKNRISINRWKSVKRSKWDEWDQKIQIAPLGWRMSFQKGIFQEVRKQKMDDREHFLGIDIRWRSALQVIGERTRWWPKGAVALIRWGTAGNRASCRDFLLAIHLHDWKADRFRLGALLWSQVAERYSRGARSFPEKRLRKSKKSKQIYKKLASKTGTWWMHQKSEESQRIIQDTEVSRGDENEIYKREEPKLWFQSQRRETRQRCLSLPRPSGQC